LRKERRLRVFENRVLRKIFGPKRDGITGGNGEDYVLRSLMVCILHKYYLGVRIEKNEIGGACSTYGGEERYVQDIGGKIGGKETTWKTEA
jgi:hypothetical protein